MSPIHTYSRERGPRVDTLQTYFKKRQLENAHRPLNDPEHEPKSLIRSTSSIKSWYDKNDPLVWTHTPCSTPVRTTILLLYCYAIVLKHSGDTLIPYHTPLTFKHSALSTHECPLPYSTMSMLNEYYWFQIIRRPFRRLLAPLSSTP